MTGDALVGRPKVVVARDHVRAVNPWSEIAVAEADLAALRPAWLAGLDAVAVAVDNHRARLLSARLLHAARVPWVDAGTRADLATVRATVCRPAAGACLLDSWGPEQLARAGEDTGAPCAAATAEAPFASTLAVAQAAAALVVHELLALAGVSPGPARDGFELRLDLQHARLERIRLPLAAACAAEHALATAPSMLEGAPVGIRLGSLMARCGAGADTVVVLPTTALVESAACTRCFRTWRPFTADAFSLEPCRACGAAAVALRRVRRVRWGDAAGAVESLAASAWLRPGDVFALVDGDAVRAWAFPAAALRGETGRPWVPDRDAPRFARLPRTLDLARVRATRLGVLGLGHVGAAIVHALAPLPWRGLLLVDRDRVELHNLPAHALAGAAGRAS